MIQGKIKTTWTAKDFIKGSWRTNKNHYLSFNTTSKNKQIYKKNVGVYINNTVDEKFEKIANKFKLKNTVIALNKMKPGQILPFHTDTCRTFIKRNKVKDKSKIMRIIVFLQNSEPGHQLWIGNKVCTGTAGSYFGWQYGEEHMAANLGKKDRYTLQITGVKK